MEDRIDIDYGANLLKWLGTIVFVVSILPFLLIISGLDLGATAFDSKNLGSIDYSDADSLNVVFNYFSGPLTHTIFEWLAICTAMFTVTLACAYYYSNGNPTIPVMAMALFCAAGLDAVHILAADRFITAAADNHDLIPFTWAISRIFNATLIAVAVSIFIFKPTSTSVKTTRNNILTGSVSAVFILLVYIAIQYCLHQPALPQTTFPDALISRPWDLAPLLIYIFLLVYLLPQYSKKYPGLFARSLTFSMFPAILTQAHMAFGSTQLFDSHFNAAHFCKILAYLTPFLGLLIDYIHTYKKQIDTASALTESKERFSLVTKATKDGVFDADILRDKVWYSENLIAMLGYDDNVAVADTNTFFKKILHPADKHRVIKQFHEQIANSNAVRFECRVRKRDGEVLWVEMRADSIKDSKGNLKRVIGSLSDISERKQSELASNERARELERSNSELEQFAYVASHDLQEPLRMVANFTQLLADSYRNQLDERANAYIHYASDGAKRMQILVNDLLQYSRVGSKEQEFKVVDCNLVCRNLIGKDLSVMIRESGANIIVNKLPLVKGDEVQLTQLFQNIITNAIKYTAGNITPNVEISALEQDDKWQFSVQDNGIGIAAKFHSRIFVIFQRLHGRSEYSGTGIGLAICKKIVERHGGTIWLDSVPGTGSVFKFTLAKRDASNS